MAKSVSKCWILHDKWFGVTYKEDKESVMAAFRKLIEDGVYKEDLFSDLQNNEPGGATTRESNRKRKRYEIPIVISVLTSSVFWQFSCDV